MFTIYYNIILNTSNNLILTESYNLILTTP